MRMCPSPALAHPPLSPVLHWFPPYTSEYLMKKLIPSVRTSSPLAIVCMNDISSSTGYILNGKHFPPGATYKLGDNRVGSRMIVLRDGDEIQVPGTPQGAFVSIPSLATRPDITACSDWSELSADNQSCNTNTMPPTIQSSLRSIHISVPWLYLKLLVPIIISIQMPGEFTTTPSEMEHSGL